VDIVLFDGEDYGPGLDMMFLGAKHFAKQLSAAQLRSYNYGILLDMVGDRNLDIHPEDHSESNSPLIYQVAQRVNEELGYRTFKSSGAYTIYDDHLPLQERGMRIYDFIDFNYPYWHTTDDTEDKCSPSSLEAVGRTVEVMVYHFPEVYVGPK
jgi:Zn-dependent M28 family amino/carboxypeptidase